MVVLRARFAALPWTLRVGRLALAAVLARGLPCWTAWIAPPCPRAADLDGGS
jgi:hypothetical protein